MRWGQEERGAQEVRTPPSPTASGGARTALPRLQGGRSRQGLGGQARVGSLAFQDNPPPQRSGRGAAAGKSDPTTSASVQARPKLSVGGGGAGGSSGTRRRSRPPARQRGGTPLPLAPLSQTSPRLRTLWLRAPLARLPRPRQAARGGRRKDLGRTAVPAASPPCAPRPCPSRVRRPLPESGDKAAAPEPWCSRPAQPWPHSPLRGLNPWAPPSRSARITVRPYPRAAARLRAPALLRCPLCHRPSVPARLRAPGLGLPAPPRRAPALSPALPPLSAPSPLTSGGGGVERRPGAGREGRPRRGLRPAATRRPPSSPPAGSDPRPSPRPAARRLGAAVCATAPGGGAGEGLRALPWGDRTHPFFPKCPPRPAAGWAAGLGNGAEELPTLQFLEPTRANHLGASIRGRGAGGNRGSFFGADQSGSVFWFEILRFLAPTPTGPRSQTGTGLTSQEDPLISGESAPCLSCSTQRDSSALAQLPVKTTLRETPVAQSLPPRNDSL